MFKRTKRFVQSAISFSYIRESTSFIYRVARALLKFPEKPSQVNRLSFDEANIESEKIRHAKMSFTILFWLYSTIFVGVFYYTILLFSSDDFLGGIVGFSSSIALLALIFKYHFWLTQIKKQKLGMTVKEWFYSIFDMK
ncbi:putative intracellular multiplication protein IcmV [Piscirickettsia salmonis]|uniref:Type IV secretion system protein IcmV n=1 Tax=Piscirickettsia salmonis TaxID=1238 RepID=A0A1L6TEF0_PISSA|nr:hypothetical protein [Piscirickettsia salmonis]AKP72671.1 hypothetical protein PSLF89_529 [Piscirickettsia salmonis LF-89 = ATCC VR-1361]ALB23837.1 type IV secretion system protein IcmV [Piscirickettsia salmonis]ALY03677.1 hypothetical protein AWE47_13105 [Piscirickettsia salmonis]AMA43240.1 hypothetical protein AWJ11_13330 [Piscirickettsia salmonis]AOS35710.1 hypothetical protein AVM72_10450 [Piscirickettsia salmonis]